MTLFNGKKKTSLLLLIILIFNFAHARDAGQYLGDQKKEYSELEAMDDGNSAFVPGSFSESERKILESNPEEETSHVPGAKSKEAKYENSTGDFGITMPFEKKANYIEHTNRDIFKEVYREGRWGLSFNYLTDEYDVTDPNGIFQKTYVQSARANRYGGLLISLDRYFYRGFIDMAFGMNFGMSMSKGNGTFSTSQSQSDTLFTLWTLPLDLSLTFELPIGRFLNLAVTGGPSAMGLYQNRNDKESGEAFKYRRQVSPGYFAMAKLKISLANMFSSSAFSLFSDYKITNYYLNLMVRHQNYANFQDELTISGSSIGAGFTFDYY